MADKRIDQLTEASELGDSDLLVVEQESVAKKATGEVISNYINGKLRISDLASEVLSLSLEVSTKQNKLTFPLSIAQGGTGADNAEDARKNLGLGDFASVNNVIEFSGNINLADEGWTLTIGSGINPSTGGNMSGTKYARSSMWHCPDGALVKIDNAEYEFTAWTYTTSATTSAARNLTGGGYQQTPLFVRMQGSELFFRCGFRRVDGAVMTSGASDPSSDEYKINAAFKVILTHDPLFKNPFSAPVSERVGTLLGRIFEEIPSADFVEGYYSASGVFNPPSASRLEKSAVIENSPSAVWFRFGYVSNNAMFCRFVAYDADGAVIDYDDLNTSYGHYIERSYTAPVGTVRVTVSWRSYGSDTAEVMAFFNERKPDTSITDLFRDYSPFYAHTFIDDIEQTASETAIIPSQSIFDIEVCRRLGFKIMEANCAVLSDGNIVVIHGGAGDTWGYEVTDLNGRDISSVTFSANDLAWVKANVRYKSTVPRFRVAPLEFSEWLYACKRNGMIPLFRWRNDEQVKTADAIMGKGNYILYSANKSEYPDATVMMYSASLTLDQIKETCKDYEPPFMYNCGNIGSFSDEDANELVRWMHSRGFLVGICGCYLSGARNQKYLGMGFDFSASDHNIPNFGFGNRFHASSDTGWDAFTTDGTINADGSLTLQPRQTVTISATIPTMWLSAASLHMVADGEVLVNFGSRYLPTYGKTLTKESALSDSTFYVNTAPTITIGASTAVTLYSLQYDVSEF